MILHAIVVCAIGIMVSLFLLYIYNYFRYLNQTAEFERKRQKMEAVLERTRYDHVIKVESCGEKSWKFVPHGGWNFASTPTERDNMAETFQNSQLNSTQASGTKKRIRENS